MRVKISYSDGTYKLLKNPSKQKIAGLSTVLEAKKGNCVVTYAPTYHNEFDFEGGDDFREKIIPCVEKELLKEFKS